MVFGEDGHGVFVIICDVLKKTLIVKIVEQTSKASVIPTIARIVYGQNIWMIFLATDLPFAGAK